MQLVHERDSAALSVAPRPGLCNDHAPSESMIEHVGAAASVRVRPGDEGVCPQCGPERILVTTRTRLEVSVVMLQAAGGDARVEDIDLRTSTLPCVETTTMCAACGQDFGGLSAIDRDLMVQSILPFLASALCF